MHTDTDADQDLEHTQHTNAQRTHTTLTHAHTHAQTTTKATKSHTVINGHRHRHTHNRRTQNTHPQHNTSQHRHKAAHRHTVRDNRSHSCATYCQRLRHHELWEFLSHFGLHRNHTSKDETVDGPTRARACVLLLACSFVDRSAARQPVMPPSRADSFSRLMWSASVKEGRSARFFSCREIISPALRDNTRGT
jgi:hypothetical protein